MRLEPSIYVDKIYIITCNSKTMQKKELESPGRFAYYRTGVYEELSSGCKQIYPVNKGSPIKHRNGKLK